MLSIEEIKNKVFNANSVEKLKEFPSSCIDLVVTSPPYDELRDYGGGDSSCLSFEDFKSIARELYRVVKDGGVVVWVVADQTKDGGRTLMSYRQALYFQEVGFKMFDTIIYEKSGVPLPHPNRYFNNFEYMFVLSKGNPKTTNIIKDRENKYGGTSSWGCITARYKDGTLVNKGQRVIQEFSARTTIWRYHTGNSGTTQDKIAYKHPATFPEKLARDHIISWSNEGDIVLDPFGGSGTTAKVAKLLGRDYVTIELVEEYCDIINKRLSSVDSGILEEEHDDTKEESNFKKKVFDF